MSILSILSRSRRGWLPFLVGAFSCMGTPAVIAGPVTLNSSYQPYFQNFDFLPTALNNAAGTLRWTNDATQSGWFIHMAGSPTGGSNGQFLPDGSLLYVADGLFSPSSPTLGYGVYSLGSSGAFNRSFGSAPSSETGEISSVLLFRNTRSYPMRLQRVSYICRAYRRNTSSTPERISLSWQVFDSVTAFQQGFATTTSVNGPVLNPAAWQPIANAVAAFPMNEADANGLPLGQLNPATTTIISDIQPAAANGTRLSVDVPPGRLLALRWGNVNDAGTDGLIGIDDVALEFGEQECDLTALSRTQATRQPGALPDDPRDDTVTAVVEVFPTGNASTGSWNITAPAAAARTGLSYGENTLTLPARLFDAGGPVRLTIVDAGNPVCSTELSLTGPSCGFTVQAADPVISSDGSNYSIQMTVHGQYVGRQFFLSHNPSITGSLGQTVLVSNLPMRPSGGTTTLRLRDVLPEVAGTTFSCEKLITLTPPRILGLNNLTSQPILTSVDPTLGTSPWSVSPPTNPADATTARALLSNAGAEAGSSLSSEQIPLSGLTGLLRLRAELTASETSTEDNFETDDQLKFEAVLDEGLPTERRVNLTSAFDTGYQFSYDQPGWINGFTSTSLPYNSYRHLDEFNRTADPDNSSLGIPAGGQLSTTFPISFELPEGTETLRLVVSGDNDATDETFSLSRVVLERVNPELIVSEPANVQRLEGPTDSPFDDLVAFSLTISNPVGGTGWKAASGASPSQGSFGTVSFTLPISRTSIVLQDLANPALSVTRVIAAPARYVLGRNAKTGSVITTSLASFPPAEWVNDPSAQTVRLSNSNGLEKELLSEVISLAGVTGDLELRLVLEASETSGTTNFETNDVFRAELILDGNTSAPVSLLDPAWDRTEFAGARSGFLNGYDGTDDFPYNAFLSRDEFNRNAASPYNFGHYPASARDWTARFEMRRLIPDSIQSVQIRIIAANNSTTEAFLVRDVLLADSTTDRDRDGMTDAYETAHGLNPDDPDDAETDKDADGVSNAEESYLGTPANQAGPRGIRLQIIPVAGQQQLQFSAAAAIRYQVQFSATLSDWQDHGPILSGTGLQQVPMSLSEGLKGFWRLKIMPK